MDALLFVVVVSLLIIAGVISSVRLYTRGALGTGRIETHPTGARAQTSARPRGDGRAS